MSLDDCFRCPCCGHALDVPKGRKAQRDGRVRAVRAMRLDGRTVREIAGVLGLSVSQAHHWVEESRKLADMEDAR
jgi:transposase